MFVTVFQILKIGINRLDINYLLERLKIKMYIPDTYKLGLGI